MTTKNAVRGFLREVRSQLTRDPWRPKEVFVVAWTGGYENPQFAVKSTRELAEALAELWIKDAATTDDFKVLRIDLEHMTITTVVSRFYDDDQGRWVKVQ